MCFFNIVTRSTRLKGKKPLSLADFLPKGKKYTCSNEVRPQP